MSDKVHVIGIRTSTGIQPYSSGRLTGDLLIRYRMPPDQAVEIARAFSEAIEVAHEKRGIAIVDTDTLRRAVDDLLDGKPVDDVAEQVGAAGRARHRYAVRFKTPPESPEISRLQDSAGAFALNMLAEATAGKGDPELVKLVGELLAEVQRTAPRGRETDSVLKDAIGSTAVERSRLLLMRGQNEKAEEEFKVDIRDVLRWLIGFLGVDELAGALLGSDDDGDDPRDAPPPTIFGEEISAQGWQIRQELVGWQALRKTGKTDDEMRITGSYYYIGQLGTMAPKEDEFQRDGQSRPGNSHLLGGATLIPGVPGYYTAVHLLSEEDITDEETAKKAANIITGILGKITAGVISSGQSAAADATGIPGAGLVLGIVKDLIAGPALDAAGKIVGDKLREILSNAFGPETFRPVVTNVLVTWPAFAGGMVPKWFVSVQGYDMGSKFGPGQILSQRYPNGMPYTVQVGGPGRYTYQFRFRVG